MRAGLLGLRDATARQNCRLGHTHHAGARVTRLERALGILLQLSGGAVRTAPDLAAYFRVAVRTIYRDVEMLALLGVPVVGGRGQGGGYRIDDNYLVPAVAFSRAEATALLLTLSLVRSLRVTPLAGDLATAEKKLLATLPKTLRPLAEQASRLIVFERAASDVFHADPSLVEELAPVSEESRAVDTFLGAILSRTRVDLHYRSPYRSKPKVHDVDALGLLWDRDYWYLVAARVDKTEPLLFRADRVQSIKATTLKQQRDGDFDVRSLLGRAWLTSAMQSWAKSDGVTIRMNDVQAERLKSDWYYRHAIWTAEPEGGWLMQFSEGDRDLVFALLRWLGPGAELVAPESWRSVFHQQLIGMANAYGEGQAWTPKSSNGRSRTTLPPTT